MTSSSLTDNTIKADFISLEQAAQWYATLYSGNCTPEDQQMWRSWLHEKPEHLSAWRHIESVSQRFQPLREQGGRSAAIAGYKAAANIDHSRRRLLKGISSMAGVSFLGWASWHHMPMPSMLAAWQADHHTDAGEQSSLTLQDGTLAWLNTDTAINVLYHDEARVLQLVKGEILIDTASDDKNRPFLVETEFGRLQALGTHFSVWQTDHDTALSVYDGRVEIRTTSGQIQIVSAGQQTHFSLNSIAALKPAEQSRQSWSQGIIVADNLSLGELITELNRYHRGHLGIAPELESIRVMGVYPTSPEKALNMLANNLPIRISKTLPWWITVKAL